MEHPSETLGGDRIQLLIGELAHPTSRITGIIAITRCCVSVRVQTNLCPMPKGRATGADPDDFTP